MGLINSLSGAPNLNMNRMDQLYWGSENSACFSICSLYKLMERQRESKDFALKLCWYKPIQFSLQFFIWLALSGEIKI